MSRPGIDNIVTMRAHRQSSTIVPISSRRTAVVVHMPSRWARADKHAATVITMPTRIDCAAADNEAADNEAKAQELLRRLPSAVRVTLLALFAWLGWPRPTHGKDPGAAGARPWKPAFVRLVSTLRLPEPSLFPRRAAVVVDLPVSRGADFDSIKPHAA